MPEEDFEIAAGPQSNPEYEFEPSVRLDGSEDEFFARIRRRQKETDEALAEWANHWDVQAVEDLEVFETPRDTDAQTVDFEEFETDIAVQENVQRIVKRRDARKLRRTLERKRIYQQTSARATWADEEVACAHEEVKFGQGIIQIQAVPDLVPPNTVIDPHS